MKIWNTTGGCKVIQILAGRSNVFLVTEGIHNILIDTSIGMTWKLLKIHLNKLNIKHIDYLILTHSHLDHVANAFRIKEKYQAKVIIHKNEAYYLVSGKNHIPGGTSAFTRGLIKAVGFLASLIKNKPCSYDILVESFLDLKEIAGINAFVLHTPGHSPGSVSVIIDNEIALVGDSMIGSWGVFPPFADDVQELLESWRKLLDTNCMLFIPSHGTENSRELVEKEYNKKIV